MFGHYNCPRRLKYTCTLPPISLGNLAPSNQEISYKIYQGNLGQWLDDQRKAHRGKKGMLSMDRHILLQKLVDSGKCVISSIHHYYFIIC
jgi:hypothetical protein